jgi:hypothetical protein
MRPVTYFQQFLDETLEKINLLKPTATVHSDTDHLFRNNVIQL